ncbi:MAG: hypothetical protein A2X49_08720 [Lentisphaerae bacterium GWF2_52_8]|nr:MAG: hypothetical protein A2X49_08720 [Lentisphaerae bacterium GWF2_52_8]
MGRAKGSGYIFKKGKVFYLQTKVNGQTKVISLRTGNRLEAERKVQQMIVPAIEAKTKEEFALYVTQARKLVSSNSLTLAEAWDKYLKSPKRRETCSKTEANHKTRFERFKTWLAKAHPGVQTIAQVSDSVTSEYAGVLWEEGLTAKTFNDHIMALRLVFKTLAREAGISENPFGSHNIEKKAEEHQTRRELSETELLNILAAPDSPELHLMNKDEMKVLLHLGAWGGLRLKDAALLKWDTVNMDMGQISVVPSKTRRNKRPVIIPLHPALKAELEKARDWDNGSGYILPMVAERYGRNPAGIVKDIGRIFRHTGIATTAKSEKYSRRKLNVAVAGFHSLRHSFVSFCAKKGIPMAIVQSLVGHGNPAMTRHYTHIGTESARQAIAALPTLTSKSLDIKQSRSKLINSLIEKLNEQDEETLRKAAILFKIDF